MSILGHLAGTVNTPQAYARLLCQNLPSCW